MKWLWKHLGLCHKIVYIKIFFTLAVVILFINRGVGMAEASKEITLPDPLKKSNVSLETAISKRRSVRTFANRPLALKQVSQILWSGQGITSSSGFRAAPSAGALYPIELYIIVNNVEELEKGIYLYIPEKHSLKLVKSGDYTAKVYNAGLYQDAIREAPVTVLISAVYNRTTSKYGERGKRYVLIEVGHVAQNIHLQAVSLNLGSVPIGAFHDSEMKKLLPLEGDPLYLIPIGFLTAP